MSRSWGIHHVLARLVCCPNLGLSAERRDYALGEQVLRLNAFPVLQAAKVRDNRKLSDSAFLFQVLDLANDFFRRTNETNLLLHDLLIAEFRQRLQRTAGI